MTTDVSDVCDCCNGFGRERRGGPNDPNGRSIGICKSCDGEGTIQPSNEERGRYGEHLDPPRRAV